MSIQHKPVLVTQVTKLINYSPGLRVWDVTLGSAGHAIAIAEAATAAGVSDYAIYGLDSDQQALARAREAWQAAGLPATKLASYQGNFATMRDWQLAHKLPYPQYILADLGWSVDQLTDKAIGLSYKSPGPLDMRLDKQLTVTAADLLMGLGERELTQMWREYADMKDAGKLARTVTAARQFGPISRTEQLNQLVREAYGARASELLPRVYQALRIAVNLEFVNLQSLLTNWWQYYRPRGSKLLVITFHSGEEKIVVGFCKSKSLKYTVYRPKQAELASNPNSRSARLYILP